MKAEKRLLLILVASLAGPLGATASELPKTLSTNEFDARFGGPYFEVGAVIASAVGFKIDGGYDVSAGPALLGINAGLSWDGAAGSQSNWHTNALARIGVPIGQLLPYVQGGVAFDGRFGWEAGVGLAFGVDRSWSVNIQASHFEIADRRSSSLQIGMRLDLSPAPLCEVKELCPPPPPPTPVPESGGAK